MTAAISALGQTMLFAVAGVYLGDCIRRAFKYIARENNLIDKAYCTSINSETYSGSMKTLPKHMITLPSARQVQNSRLIFFTQTFAPLIKGLMILSAASLIIFIAIAACIYFTGNQVVECTSNCTNSNFSINLHVISTALIAVSVAAYILHFIVLFMIDFPELIKHLDTNCTDKIWGKFFKG